MQHFLHNTSGLRPQRLNASRRCVPDVSIYSTEYYIVQDGGETVIGGTSYKLVAYKLTTYHLSLITYNLGETVIGGTSAAVPVLAGMLAAINDELIAEGGTPLGCTSL